MASGNIGCLQSRGKCLRTRGKSLLELRGRIVSAFWENSEKIAIRNPTFKIHSEAVSQF